jgi:drug/metabolite transporter (DMT)-like permease
MKKGRLIGCLALVASAFLWATAYIAVKQLVAEVPPSVLLAFRFSFAAIILAVICIPKFKHYTKDLLFSGMKMGTAMFFEFFLFTVALQYTSASKSSFIIASYIIILPIVYYKKKKTDRQRCTCICNLYGWNLSSPGKWVGFL